MSFEVKFANFASWPQSVIIPDATPFNVGIMTAAQAAKLAMLTPGGGTANVLVAAGVHGTLTIEADQSLSDANSNLYWQYTPVEAGASSWGQVYYQQNNTVGSRKNQIHGIGWNVGYNGGAAVAGEALIALSFEDFYNPGGTPSVEFHLATQTEGAIGYRPLTFAMERVSGHSEMALQNDILYFKTRDSTTIQWQWNADGTVEANGAGTEPLITYTVNNVPILAQERAAGGLVNLLKLGADNKVTLDPDGAVGAKTGGDLLVGAGLNVTATIHAAQIGTVGTPIADGTYSNSVNIASTAAGGLDTYDAGVLFIAANDATGVHIGNQAGATATIVLSDSVDLRSPDGQAGFHIQNGFSSWIMGNQVTVAIGADIMQMQPGKSFESSGGATHLDFSSSSGVFKTTTGVFGLYGDLQNKKAANQSATVGAAGGASALPATPLGYLLITLDSGAQAKIPYYTPA